MIVGMTGNLTRDELAEVLAAKTTLKKAEAIRALDILFESMMAALAANRDIEIRRFGSLKIKLASGGPKNIPGKGLVDVLPKVKVEFRPGKDLDALLNAGRGDSEPPTQPLFPEADQPQQSESAQ